MFIRVFSWRTRQPMCLFYFILLLTLPSAATWTTNAVDFVEFQEKPFLPDFFCVSHPKHSFLCIKYDVPVFLSFSYETYFPAAPPEAYHRNWSFVHLQRLACNSLFYVVGVCHVGNCSGGWLRKLSFPPPPIQLHRRRLGLHFRWLSVGDFLTHFDVVVYGTSEHGTGTATCDIVSNWMARAGWKRWGKGDTWYVWGSAISSSMRCSVQSVVVVVVVSESVGQWWMMMLFGWHGRQWEWHSGLQAESIQSNGLLHWWSVGYR